MEEASAVPASNLFMPFLDPVDMIGCFPAGMTLGEVNSEAAKHGLRFPLTVDPQATLPDHLRVMEFAPASARFGAYVDNIPGMNWQLPSGRIVRIGERVVKSATGYDLLRFLLHTGNRFGKSVEFVLRLRPIGGEVLLGRFHGSEDVLEALRTAIARSSWNHWIDSVDLLVSEDSDCVMEVAVDTLPGEGDLFVKWFNLIATDAGVRFSVQSGSTQMGLPAYSVKCLPSKAAKIASCCVAEHGGMARVLLINGCILVYPARDPGPEWVDELSRQIAETGGHVLKPSGHSLAQSPDEAQWIDGIEQDWRSL